MNSLVATLDSKRRDLARAVVEGQDVDKAAHDIGFTADQLAATLQNATFALAIRTELQRKLNNVTAPQAVAVLEELMNDKSVLPSVRRQAASDLLDRSGYIAPKATERDKRSENTPLSDMSTDALQAMVSRLETELSDRARPVGVPNGPVSALSSDKTLKVLS